MANMAAKAVGHVMVALHTSQGPTNEEWDAFLDQCRALIASAGNDITRVTFLVFTDGGAPSSRQRNGIKEMSQGKSFRSAVVTDSRLAQGVVAIISWFQVDIRAFDPTDWKQALLHANVAAGDEPQVWQAIRELLPSLGELKVLAPLLGPGGPGAAQSRVG